MGLQNKIIEKAAEGINDKTSTLFKDIIRIQESMHAHLEKILECQRETLNLLRKREGLEPLEWKDAEQ